jgi:hypothetical protein
VRRRRRDVAMRAEHRCKLPGRRPRPRLRQIAFDDVPQRAPFVDRAAAQDRDERVCALTAELRRQQVGEGRREDEPRRQSQIFRMRATFTCRPSINCTVACSALWARLQS